MILFCEDCGKKNILDSTGIKNGKALFRCDSCNYLNSYYITAVPATHFDKIGEFLNSIQPFPEIIGSFLFHKKTGLLKNNMPEILKATDLNTLGEILINNYLACRSQYNDVTEMGLIISNRNMIVKMVDKDLAVIIASKIFPLSKNIMNQLACLVSNDNS